MSISIPYPGGKGRLAKQIVSFLPREGRIYLEPFAGRANLFWEAAEQGLKFKKWWLNDLATASFLDAIRTHGDTIEIPRRSRAEFERQRRAYKLAIRRPLCLHRIFRSAVGFTIPDAKVVPETEMMAAASHAADTNKRCVSATEYSHAPGQRSRHSTGGSWG
jgi:hypothetical protein